MSVLLAALQHREDGTLCSNTLYRSIHPLHVLCVLLFSTLNHRQMDHKNFFDTDHQKIKYKY